MRVSFDLDDTLFVSPDNFKTEKELRFPFNKIYKERLRLGTIKLFQYLKELGTEVWIYTTSYRSEGYIRGLLRRYGLKPDAVVNGERHAREVQGSKGETMPSKYPGKYRIDLHIDDDVSVAQNGRTYGFKVFIIGEQDDAWVEKIIKEVERIRYLTQNK
ncbi:MAG: HAD family hydrolase [Lachnospiraceae bacterium]|nr:HAD family hydrolase [Lachnospiraceae bacterium]